MSGLLLELRRQIAHNRRKAAHMKNGCVHLLRKPQEVFSQKTKETKPDTEIQPEVQERKVNVQEQGKISYLARLMNSENALSSYSHCLIPERRRHRNQRR